MSQSDHPATLSFTFAAPQDEALRLQRGRGRGGWRCRSLAVWPRLGSKNKSDRRGCGVAAASDGATGGPPDFSPCRLTSDCPLALRLLRHSLTQITFCVVRSCCFFPPRCRGEVLRRSVRIKGAYFLPYLFIVIVN